MKKIGIRLLIGLVVIAIVFLSGFLTDHFTRYSPMKSELTETLSQTQDDLNQANQSIADLESKINNLTTQLADANERIAALEQEKEDLQTNLDSATLHLELSRTLFELRTAQIELGNGNAEEARQALSKIAPRLETLKPSIETVDANLATNMETRLTLILDSMDSNPTTAQADLGLLVSNLQSVEVLLFGEE